MLQSVRQKLSCSRSADAPSAWYRLKTFVSNEAGTSNLKGLGLPLTFAIKSYDFTDWEADDRQGRVAGEVLFFCLSASCSLALHPLACLLRFSLAAFGISRRLHLTSPKLCS